MDHNENVLHVDKMFKGIMRGLHLEGLYSPYEKSQIDFLIETWEEKLFLPAKELEFLDVLWRRSNERKEGPKVKKGIKRYPETTNEHNREEDYKSGPNEKII